MSTEEFFDLNRRNWADRLPVHLRDTNGFYRIDQIVDGADSLHAIESGEIGNVAGKRLLHLQCHFGLDTVSLARRGAIVTGLDFVPSAIASARDIAMRAGVAVQFVEGNVYNAALLAPGPFDIVYTTWGTIPWLPDLVPWAQAIASVLAPGGFFYFADGHPATQVMEEVEGRLEPTYGWRTPQHAPLRFETPATYNGDPALLAHPHTCEWIHPVSDIVGALLGAGLRIEMLHEHDRLPWKPFPMMIAAGDGLFGLPEAVPPLPLALSLRARKP